MRIFNRLHKAIGLLEYFSSQDWEWNSENLSMLMSQLTPEDRKVGSFTYMQPVWVKCSTFLDCHQNGLYKPENCAYVLQFQLNFPEDRRV